MMEKIIDLEKCPEFYAFFHGCIDIYENHMKRHFPTWLEKGLKYDEFTFKNNRKYIKVISNGSAFCFVDKSNGDVLKPASWSAPAKHARGNIFDKHSGLGAMSAYGPAYLRG